MPAAPLRPASSPSRVVHLGDALSWLAAQPVLAGASVITSLPDARHVRRELGPWERWFVDAVAKVLSRLEPGAAGIFFQTDVRGPDGWVDKGALVQEGAAAAGLPLVFHKIVCRVPAGTPRDGLAGYAHLLCFGRGLREDHARPTPDVLPDAGRATWTRGMGLEACAFACRWVIDHTPTRVVVDPFCGHGTVLAVANMLGLAAIGVEIDPIRARRARTLRVMQTERGLVVGDA